MVKNDSLQRIKGIGEKTSRLFNELGVFDIEDLVHFYPIRYLPYEELVSIEELTADNNAAVSARIISSPKTIRAGKLKITEAYIEDYSGKIRCVWYNCPYIVTNITKEKEYVFSGKVTERKGKRVIEHPVIYDLNEYRKMAGGLQPVYRTVRGLSQKIVRKAVSCALSEFSFGEDFLPVDIREKYGLVDNDTAGRTIHQANSSSALEQARKRVVFDEFFNFLYSIKRLKNNPVAKSEFIINTENILDEFAAKLDFSLTGDQIQAVRDIFGDFKNGKVMNRLLQGDVGSGKTIVSLIAMYAVCRSGYQSVIMVPTEVLASQHYQTCMKIFADFEDKPRIGLLTGSMSNKEKKAMHEEIESGRVDIIIGTHAVIQDSVVFHDAGLVVTDEQHRFGVKQRERLADNGKSPHVLVMSATPIPRTLAVILYGDLDISTIMTKPDGRLPVKNAVIIPKDRGKAYRTILDQINAGHQAYIICPMIEENEAVEAENVIDYTSKIKCIFPENIVVQFLHGRMSPEEKNNIMCSFANGDINILISTTVVEVGVDVPNATVMMIENAERFGLATLHQLRGRVGRGDDQSYCIFVRTSDSEVSKQRLKVVGDSNDGFFIASEDLRLRGPGEILGQAQSGDMRFELGNIYTDADILDLARECCEYIDTSDFRPDDDEFIRFRKHMEDYRDKRLINLSI
ncbi:MAG: ATP-dependent DNA helicase RecG [Lachnospiraceae bacterium]|nr:ATP-dependent DNA helicase RecG [Lachnospiraceae bacterium]